MGCTEFCRVVAVWPSQTQIGLSLGLKRSIVCFFFDNYGPSKNHRLRPTTPGHRWEVVAVVVVVVVVVVAVWGWFGSDFGLIRRVFQVKPEEGPACVASPTERLVSSTGSTSSPHTHTHTHLKRPCFVSFHGNHRATHQHHLLLLLPFVLFPPSSSSSSSSSFFYVSPLIFFRDSVCVCVCVCVCVFSSSSFYSGHSFGGRCLIFYSSSSSSSSSPVVVWFSWPFAALFFVGK